MTDAETKKNPWPPASPDEAREELGTIIPKPKDASEQGYGHALTILTDLKKSLPGKVDPEVLISMVEMIRDYIKRGCLPDDALDLIGYEEDSGDWRE